MNLSNRPMRVTSIDILSLELLCVPIYIGCILFTAGQLLLVDTTSLGCDEMDFEMRYKIIVFGIAILSEALITGIAFLPIGRPQEVGVEVKKQRVLLLIVDSIPFLSFRFIYTVFAGSMHQPAAVVLVTAILLEATIIGLFLTIAFLVSPLWLYRGALQ
jgi:hypothetical protein